MRGDFFFFFFSEKGEKDVASDFPLLAAKLRIDVSRSIQCRISKAYTLIKRKKKKKKKWYNAVCQKTTTAKRTHPRMNIS